jgi:hypothetical protein
MDEDALSQQLAQIPKSEILIPKLKLFCLKVLESTTFDTISMSLISMYTIFILFWLTMADIFGVDQ